MVPCGKISVYHWSIHIIDNHILLEFYMNFSLLFEIRGFYTDCTNIWPDLTKKSLKTLDFGANFQIRLWIINSALKLCIPLLLLVIGLFRALQTLKKEEKKTKPKQKEKKDKANTRLLLHWNIMNDLKSFQPYLTVK